MREKSGNKIVYNIGEIHIFYVSICVYEQILIFSIYSQSKMIDLVQCHYFIADEGMVRLVVPGALNLGAEQDIELQFTVFLNLHPASSHIKVICSPYIYRIKYNSIQ